MTKQTAKKIATSSELSSILLSTLDEKLFFNYLGSFIHSLMKSEVTLVNLVNEDESVKLVYKNGKIVKRNKVIEKGHGVAGHVIKTKRAYFSNSIKRDPIFANTEIEMEAELALPVLIDGVIIATIHLQSSEDQAFSRDQVTAITEVLNELSQPLANMRMYLSAKRLNESLIKQIELKEKELKNKVDSIKMKDTFKVSEKEVIAISESMSSAVMLADKASNEDVSCFIIGDKGAGKEMIARRIHCRSKRQDYSFLSVDCSFLSEEHLERDIFGEEGSSLRPGLLEMGNGGSLMINNIEKMPLYIQGKLNLFLKEGIAFRKNGTMPYKSNVRVFAASTKNVSLMVKEQTFREDLYFNLGTITVRVPSLSQRKEDIETLANFFLNAGKGKGEMKSFSPCAIKLFSNYSWPGNVRELQNIAERAFILSDGLIVDKDHVKDSLQEEAQSGNDQNEESEEAVVYVDLTLEELERKHICMTLDHLGGNKTKTAKNLGITVKTLYNKLHNYGMIAVKEA